MTVSGGAASCRRPLLSAPTSSWPARSATRMARWSVTTTTVDLGRRGGPLLLPDGSLGDRRGTALHRSGDRRRRRSAVTCASRPTSTNPAERFGFVPGGAIRRAFSLWRDRARGLARARCLARPGIPADDAAPAPAHAHKFVAFPRSIGDGGGVRAVTHVADGRIRRRLQVVNSDSRTPRHVELAKMGMARTRDDVRARGSRDGGQVRAMSNGISRPVFRNELVDAGQDWAVVAVSGRGVEIDGTAPSEEAQKLAVEAASRCAGAGSVSDRSELLGVRFAL